MHSLAVNSVSTLLDRFSELLKHSKMEYSDWKYTAVEGEKPALFITELHLENSQFGFHPTIEDFTEDVSTVIRQFEETVLSVANLVPDPFFDAFTRPMINKNFEAKTCGEGPDLSSIFNDDRNLKELVLNIRDCLDTAFKAANNYATTLNPLVAFYAENEKMDVDQFMTLDPTLEFFGDALKKYSTEIKGKPVYSL